MAIPALQAESPDTQPAPLSPQPASKPAEPEPKPAATPAEPALKAATLPAAQKSPGKSTGKNRTVGGRLPSKKKDKGKFRETLWFKKGDLDAAAAQAAAQKAQQSGDALVADKADSLPMEDRYKDDGSISHQDREQHSLRTGNTEMMQAVTPEDVRRSMEADAGVTEQDLIADMQAGRNKIIIGVVIGLLVVIAIVAFLAS
jgi:hypothetical protein